MDTVNQMDGVYLLCRAKPLVDCSPCASGGSVAFELQSDGTLKK